LHSRSCCRARRHHMTCAHLAVGAGWTCRRCTSAYNNPRRPLPRDPSPQIPMDTASINLLLGTQLCVSAVHWRRESSAVFLDAATASATGWAARAAQPHKRRLCTCATAHTTQIKLNNDRLVVTSSPPMQHCACSSSEMSGVAWPHQSPMSHTQSVVTREPGTLRVRCCMPTSRSAAQHSADSTCKCIGLCLYIRAVVYVTSALSQVT
jgi:hypothetical protein